MDKLQQLKQNLDEWKKELEDFFQWLPENDVNHIDAKAAREIKQSYDNKVYTPTIELLLELGLNEDKAEEGVG